MQKKLVAAPAIAGLLALPVAGYVTWQLMDEIRFGFEPPAHPLETGLPAQQPLGEAQGQANVRHEAQDGRSSAATQTEIAETDRVVDLMAPGPVPQVMTRDRAPQTTKLMAPPTPMPDAPAWHETSRDRFESFQTNPVRSALEDPVSTFSIDVDTASYAFVRRMLKSGMMPDADSVRVEEMINYFPYAWPGPDSIDTPFNASVTVMPTPWNEHTKLMHVGIKGYELQLAERPRANLVFLIDSSGSMNADDRLPLLKSSMRLLLDQLAPEDTVSIVTYAGNAGTVLEPTPAADRRAIIDALEAIESGGRTAGEAGIREAYRLAERSFVEGGVNRVILATDGDFNIGASSDEELKKLVENKRGSGVFLSILGFGRGNFNDQLMQTLAQNGNGTASYIDTLAEAEKVLVEEAASTLFTIAKDVKIQVEFNPQMIAEYRLIGYETRALNREDFNNDRVDAGEIGSGHTVTAIYEITPAGSPAQLFDDLRYGAQAPAANEGQGAGEAGEYAFVKIRHKAPDGDVSTLTTRAVTRADEPASLDAVPEDVRFSVAVAAFGQKLRGTDAVAQLGYDEIMEIATAARGTDPFGYRAEFLSLVRLASALDGRR